MQKKLFSNYFGAHRYFYNKAIEQFNITSEKNEPSESFITTRNKVVTNIVDLKDEDNNLWMKDIPHTVKELAVKSAITSRSSAFSNLRNGNINHFKMRFINKKTSNNIFYTSKRALTDGHIFKNKLYEDIEVIGKSGKILKKKKRIKYSEIISRKDYDAIEQNDSDFAIKQEKDGKYYILVIIKPIDIILENKQNICALDPGVRTFQTMYSEESTGEFGFNTSEIIRKLYERIDKLTSLLARSNLENPLNSKKRYKLTKRCAVLRTKVQNITTDLHWKTCDYLTKNFQVILLPIFSTKQMSNRNNRTIGKKTVRLMAGLSHYKFQQKLLYKAKQRGKNVILCKEHYTSKCCGKCGTLNESLGSKKIFHCNSCDLVMDRDIHAARNILIRGLTIYSESLVD